MTRHKDLVYSMMKIKFILIARLLEAIVLVICVLTNIEVLRDDVESIKVSINETLSIVTFMIGFKFLVFTVSKGAFHFLLFLPNKSM